MTRCARWWCRAATAGQSEILMSIDGDTSIYTFPHCFSFSIIMRCVLFGISGYIWTHHVLGLRIYRGVVAVRGVTSFILNMYICVLVHPARGPQNTHHRNGAADRKNDVNTFISISHHSLTPSDWRRNTKQRRVYGCGIMIRHYTKKYSTSWSIFPAYTLQIGSRSYFCAKWWDVILFAMRICVFASFGVNV